MFRVLLIQPAIEDFFFTPARSYPLGLLSLATVLEQAGFQVRILNSVASPTRRTVPIPFELAYARQYYQPNQSAFRLFSGYYRFGADDAYVGNEIRSFAPHIVGISLNFTAYLDSGFRLARLIKQIDSRITIVAGGRAATAQPALVMRNAAFEYLIRGEAEFSLRELCLGLRRGESLKRIAGLCLRRPDGSAQISRRVALIKDLNRLPPINHALIDVVPYKFQGRSLASLLASRGCALGCSFCAIQERFRFRGIESIVKEMEQGYSRGIRHFNFEDDTINLHPQFEQLLDAIHARFKDTIRISFMNGLLSRGLTSRIVAKLSIAGLTHADFSVGSMVPRLRKDMNRREDARQIFQAAKRLQKHNIPSTVHYIIGYPGQTFNYAVRDIRELAQEPVLLGPSIFYPVPGSAIFPRIAHHYQAENSYRLMRSSAASFTQDIPRDRLMTLLYLSRVVNAIKEELDKTGKGPKGPEWEALFKQHKICRVVKNNDKQPELIPEEFVRPENVRAILHNLEICSLKGKKFRVPVRLK